MRKYLNPDRVPNNDILDFISRVPDDETLVRIIYYIVLLIFQISIRPQIKVKQFLLLNFL